MPVLFSKRNFLSQVVTVTAFAVDNLSQHALLCHMKYHHLVSSIYTVLHQHDRRSRLFILFHQFPALSYRIGAAHLAANVFSRCHGLHADVQMMIPRGAQNHRVNLRHLQDFSVVCDRLRPFSSLLFQKISCLFTPVFIYVADSRNLHIRMVNEHLLQQPLPAASKPD